MPLSILHYPDVLVCRHSLNANIKVARWGRTGCLGEVVKILFYNALVYPAFSWCLCPSYFLMLKLRWLVGGGRGTCACAFILRHLCVACKGMSDACLDMAVTFSSFKSLGFSNTK